MAVPSASRSVLLLAVLLLVPAAAQAGPNTGGAPSTPPKPHSAKPPAGATLIRTAAHKTAHLAPPATPQRAKPGQSVGSPTQGHLVGGAQIVESPYLRIVPFYKGSDARWGLESLVGLIDRSARSVRKQFPDAVLSVGHLSKHGGGEIDRHASHESGRDADIGFFIKSQSGKAIYSDHFVPFVGDGTAPSWPGARFDDARNWALVASMVGDGHAHITHIFVATPMRQRLLDYASKVGAPPNLRIRAAELMAQPKGSMPHDDHFHVRIGCPNGMEGCVEQPTPRHHAQHSAIASHVAPHGSHVSPHHAAPAGPAHPAHPAHPPAEPRDEESTKSDATPNLAPMVPGLDSAVIPAPLAVPATPNKARETPKADPIDDPDGVLESH